MADSKVCILLLMLAVLLLSEWAQAATQEETCTACHRTSIAGPHAALACADCHGEDAVEKPVRELAATARARCQKCHPQGAGVLDGPMGHRRAERAFASRTFGSVDPDFFQKNCNQCHVQSCGDCHGGGHGIARPNENACDSCHRGYFVGADYHGRAPREDALRYQRGPMAEGEFYLKMRPDVHSEAGLTCGDCHGMESLGGTAPPPACTDCHRPDPSVPEHGIAAHLEKLECYACHSAWAPQEYGTFFLRFDEKSTGKKNFRVRWQSGSEYIRSAYLRKQDAPPLGLNERGKVSPVRPQFIAFFTDIRDDQAIGAENRLLAAEWKAFFPHTVRRGTVLCQGCHENPARFLLEPEERRIFLPQEDGLALPSFWRQEGQRVVNGFFVDQEQYDRLNERSPEYLRATVEKWKSLLDGVEPSSKP